MRGFKENVLSADSGWSARNDLIFPVGRWMQPWRKLAWLASLNTRLFADYGRAYAFNGGYRGALGGWGVGIDWHYRWFGLSYTYAQAFTGEHQFVHLETPVHYFRLTAQVVF